ncbi:RNase P modulator RnpM [Acetomicrobium sp. S15 = DSM 107314]|uniref:RNase P modulator RnpM n=1 Tax=Acetomicrobium sp. S15 = DSM 107314 TaxID=2529858 RepID=UPI0018E15F1D|nr:YlxR family protein [Acetomicrobium sp. S15 = DSM 107314]
MKEATGSRRKRPRTCVGCREEFSKKGLLRVVRSPKGEVVIDPTGRMPGRGAYVCAKRECVTVAKKRDALSRALKARVPEEIYEELLSLCGENPGDGDDLSIE